MTDRRTVQMKMNEIKSSEITPEQLYLSRRRFIKGLGSMAASALVLKACGPDAGENPPTGTAVPGLTPVPGSPVTPTPLLAQLGTDELGDALTTFDAITNYNNYYEFTVQKERVARLAEDFLTSPWQVQVGGLVNRPRTFDLDDLQRFEQQQRIYRLRCVEAWSMVIPWIGFPLGVLLKEVEPLTKAKFVRFETLYDPQQMPGQKTGPYDWPYIEGLRLDEAMHDLTFLATGLYGKTLLPQNGAPVRLVVPWKYGFKSIKSIVRIDLVEEMPVSLWMAAAPNEYGFYANVNPEVDHPRWSQATERRIGESGRRETLFLNGYAEEVAHLYEGMDLSRWS
jgi:sulfoxide reductase catalytic subunit YedY